LYKNLVMTHFYFFSRWVLILEDVLYIYREVATVYVGTWVRNIERIWMKGEKEGNTKNMVYNEVLLKRLFEL
jgi:hypothetical protein